MAGGLSCWNCHHFIEIPYPPLKRGEAVCDECGKDALDEYDEQRKSEWEKSNLQDGNYYRNW